MTIEKNIAATLKETMRKREQTMAEFSEALDIPRTTLQGYLSGTSCPRADSIEYLADRLGIPVAALVSGPGGLDGVACLEPLALEIRALHPRAQTVAEHAAALLRSAFQLSDSLYGLEETPPEGRYHYLPLPLHGGYGILAKEREGEGWRTAAVAAPVSRDIREAARLAELCNRCQLAPEQLLDVVQDFLAGSP